MKKPQKIKISLEGLKELDNRKVQYDLLNIEEVLRAHVTEDGKAIVIAKPEISVEKILSAIPASIKAKVLSNESISNTELLKNTFNS